MVPMARDTERPEPRLSRATSSGTESAPIGPDQRLQELPPWTEEERRLLAPARTQTPTVGAGRMPVIYALSPWTQRRTTNPELADPRFATGSHGNPPRAGALGPRSNCTQAHDKPAPCSPPLSWTSRPLAADLRGTQGRLYRGPAARWPSSRLYAHFNVGAHASQ